MFRLVELSSSRHIYIYIYETINGKWKHCFNLMLDKVLAMEINDFKYWKLIHLKQFYYLLHSMIVANRDEITGKWRKLRNTELHALYSSQNIVRSLKSRPLRWAGHIVRMEESRNASRVLFRRPEEKRPLGRPRRRWDDNTDWTIQG